MINRINSFFEKFNKTMEAWGDKGISSGDIVRHRINGQKMVVSLWVDGVYHCTYKDKLGNLERGVFYEGELEKING